MSWNKAPKEAEACKDFAERALNRIAELEQDKSTWEDRAMAAARLIEGENKLHQRIAELERQLDSVVKYEHIDELYAQLEELNAENEKQSLCICELDDKVIELETENEELRSAIREYTTCTIEECNGEDDEHGYPCVGHAAYEECAREREELKHDIERHIQIAVDLEAERDALGKLVVEYTERIEELDELTVRQADTILKLEKDCDGRNKLVWEEAQRLAADNKWLRGQLDNWVAKAEEVEDEN